MGARMLVISGMPTAQLMYRDPNGEPFAFCLTPDIADERDLERSRAGDLQLIELGIHELQAGCVSPTSAR